jgi:hypothetical protein
MRPGLYRAIVLLEAITALPLLAYCGVLVVRIGSGDTGRLGDDVIFMGYTLAAASLILGIVAEIIVRRHGRSTFALLAHAAAGLAIGCWLILHLGGWIFSHGSLFADRSRDQSVFLELVIQKRIRGQSKFAFEAIIHSGPFAAVACPLKRPATSEE